MLKRCKWQGQLVDCESLFKIRRTYTGRCCAFNYLRPVASEIRRQTAFNHTVTLSEGAHILHYGIGFGLDVVIDQQVDDYAFSLHSNIGTRILVFSPLNFPDQTSGAIKEKFLGVGEEMIMTLEPIPITGSDEIRAYNRRARRCVFDDEIRLTYEKYLFMFFSYMIVSWCFNHSYRSFYSHSECLMVCRLDNIRHFCGCIPPQFSDLYVNTSKCMMDDLPCLTNWNLKWFNFEPFADDAKQLRNMGQLDGHCVDCIARCSFVRYNVACSTAQFGMEAFKDRRVNSEFT